MAKGHLWGTGKPVSTLGWSLKIYDRETTLMGIANENAHKLDYINLAKQIFPTMLKKSSCTLMSIEQQKVMIYTRAAAGKPRSSL